MPLPRRASGQRVRSEYERKAVDEGVQVNWTTADETYLRQLLDSPVPRQGTSLVLVIATWGALATAVLGFVFVELSSSPWLVGACITGLLLLMFSVVMSLNNLFGYSLYVDELDLAANDVLYYFPFGVAVPEIVSQTAATFRQLREHERADYWETVALHIAHHHDHGDLDPETSEKASVRGLPSPRVPQASHKLRGGSESAT